MTIYVDQLVNNLWKMRGRIVKNCHMFSDTSTEELIEFAPFKLNYLPLGNQKYFVVKYVE